jgi:Ubiquitin-2 like Rad60 SUMO-like
MADEKPDIKNEPITLKVKNATGEETVFKVKRSTKFGKIMDAYANKTGQPVNSLRFTFDGERLELVSLGIICFCFDRGGHLAVPPSRSQLPYSLSCLAFTGPNARRS